MTIVLLPILTACALTACSPKFDWRDVHAAQTPYTVLMPAKPDTVSRQILLGQQTVSMQMTGTQIDGVSFVVGAVKMPDATQAQAAMSLIKQGLLNNLHGKITHEKTTVTTIDGKILFNDEFGATSMNTDAHGSANRMLGRIVASDAWVFQVLVAGPEKIINRDAVDTFLSSFKPL